MINIRLTCISICTVLFLAGCNSNEQHASQVIAIVDGKDVTVHQLNSLLQHQAQHLEQLPTLTALTDQLVDRQLLVNAALSEKLNRLPEIVQAVEDAKAQIYAEAYVDNLMKDTTLEQHNKVMTHLKESRPDIFSQHQTYQLQVLEIQQSVPLSTIDFILFKATRFDDVAHVLAEANVKTATKVIETVAENMPQGFYQKYVKTPQSGDFIIRKSNDSMQVIGIQSISPSPLSSDETEHLLKQMTQTELKRQISESAIKQLRALAEIRLMNNKN